MNRGPAAPPLLRTPSARIVLYLFLFIVLQILISALVFVSGSIDILILPAASVIPFTLLMWRFIDRRPIGELGARWERHEGRRLMAGIFIGGLFVSLLFLGGIAIGAGALLGWQEGPLPAALGELATVLVILFIAAAAEEIAFRGYILQNLRQGGNRWTAILVSSAIFSAIHFMNPHYFKSFAPINIFLIGMVFALIRIRWNSLWLPIGLHFGWNFTLGPILSLPVSGLEMFTGLLRVRWPGEELLWTGGQFGPEGGLLCTLFLALALILLSLPGAASPRPILVE